MLDILKATPMLIVNVSCALCSVILVYILPVISGIRPFIVAVSGIRPWIIVPAYRRPDFMAHVGEETAFRLACGKAKSRFQFFLLPVVEPEMQKHRNTQSKADDGKPNGYIRKLIQ